jgi:hypothetical protein
MMCLHGMHLLRISDMPQNSLQSNSELTIARQCAQRHHWEYTEQRGRPEPGPETAAGLGTEVHARLALHYGGAGALRESERADELTAWYIQTVSESQLDSQWTVQHVEHYVEDKALGIKGICDLIVQSGTETWVVDHKTTGLASETLSTRLMRETQGVHYVSMVPDAVGIIYNIIGTGTAPALTRVSRRVGGGEVAAYRANVVRWRDALAASSQVPNPGSACTYCPFRTVCRAKQQGEPDYTAILTEYHPPRDPDSRYTDRTHNVPAKLYE